MFPDLPSPSTRETRKYEMLVRSESEDGAAAPPSEVSPSYERAHNVNHNFLIARMACFIVWTSWAATKQLAVELY